MLTRFVLAAVMAVAIGWFAAPVRVEGQRAPSPRLGSGTLIGYVCLHDARSTPADRARREQALALAKAINQAQGLAAAATQRYQPLAKLPNLPVTPAGFELRFYTDGEGYILSLKDTTDLCRYGVFTDQNGRLYEMSPQVPQIAQ
jgi:hypothetical protein